MNFDIPYWPNRSLGITIDRYKRKNYKLTVSIFPYFKDAKRNEWFYKQWWIIDLPF
jgi:hypothetical protein